MGTMSSGPAFRGFHGPRVCEVRGPNPRVRRWEARDPQAGDLRQASCPYAVVADGHPPRHGHPCDRILRVFAWADPRCMHHGISAWEALFFESCEDGKAGRAPTGSPLGHSRVGREPGTQNSLCGDPGTRSSVAAHGMGRCGNGLGEGIARGDAETWTLILRISAPLRADQPHVLGDAPRWLPVASAVVGVGLAQERLTRGSGAR